MTIDKDAEKIYFVSLLLFKWMNSVFKKGSERLLDENDYVTAFKENSDSFLTDKLQANWSKEKQSAKEIKTGLNSGKALS